MKQYTNYQERLSSIITWTRFPLVFFIIMLHCYSVQRLNGNNEFYFKILYPFSLYLGETGVPGFFFISGYLFFHSNKNYWGKLTNRIHTLLIPYILWNSIFVLLYLTAYVLGYHILICDKSFADYGITDYLRLFWDRGDFGNGNFAPILCPLWYIRNLLIMSILSPILYYTIKYCREFFIIIIFVWWVHSNDNAFFQQTTLFWSLGAYFSIFKINPLEFVLKRKHLFISLFGIFCIADIAVHVIIPTPVNLIIHRLALVFNIPFLILTANHFIDRDPDLELNLSKTVFIVFCVHYPIVLALRKTCLSIFSNASNLTHIILYFLCIFLTVILSLGFYEVLNRYLPNTKKILTGNR